MNIISQPRGETRPIGLECIFDEESDSAAIPSVVHDTSPDLVVPIGEAGRE